MRPFSQLLLIYIYCIFQNLPGNASSKSPSFCRAHSPEEIEETETGEGSIIFPPLSSPKSWLIHLGNNNLSGIAITIQDFKLQDYFLVIRDGTGNQNPHSQIQILSGVSSEQVKFKIPFGKSFYMEFCPEANQETAGTTGYFNATYKRYNLTEEPESPLVPEDSEDQMKRESFEIQLRGKPPQFFIDRSTSTMFKIAVQNMTKKYCEKNNLTYDEKDATDMVIIHAVRFCPREWIDSNNCASVLHSIFASGNEDQKVRRIWDYQLTASHLKKMWSEDFDASDLKEIGLSVFSHSDSNLALESMLMFTLPVVGFVLLSFIIWRLNKWRKGDLEHEKISSEGTLPNTRRRSKLRPNKHQIIPSFMKKENSMPEGNLPNVDLQNYCAGLLFGLQKIQNSEKKIGN